MKRFVLIVCLSFVFSLAFCQVKWDVRVGANVSNFSKGDTDMKMGVKAGVGIEYAFSELFALRPGLFYSMKGAAESGHKFTMNHNFVQSLSYLEVPVLAAFRFRVSPGLTLGVNAGPYLACRVGNSTKWGMEDMRRFDTGIDAGLDFIVHSFVVGVGAQYGFTKLTSYGNAPHNINYSLAVGYRF